MGKLKSSLKQATDWFMDPYQDLWGDYWPDSIKPQNWFKRPKMPEIPEATPMPEPDSDEVRRARRRSMIAQRGRGGRESTILTDTLG